MIADNTVIVKSFSEPQKAIFYRQSDVPEIFELSTILANLAAKHDLAFDESVTMPNNNVMLVFKKRS